MIVMTLTVMCNNCSYVHEKLVNAAIISLFIITSVTDLNPSRDPRVETLSFCHDSITIVAMPCISTHYIKAAKHKLISFRS